MQNLIFEKPPENYNAKFEVAACFIFVHEKTLFMKRSPDKPHPEAWGIPGGKCEKAETARLAVIREVQEETGILLLDQTLKTCGTVFIRYPYLDFTYHMFEFRMQEFPEIQLDEREHLEYRWITLHEALTLPLIPGEDECINFVYGIKSQDLKLSSP